MTLFGDDAAQPLWISPPYNPEWKEKIVKEFKIHPIVAQVLVTRGFSTLEAIHRYLYAKLPELYDPFLFAEMPKAVKRLIQALQNHENILIYGDNDVDGMTGTALLTEFLRFLGANVRFFISRPGVQRHELILEAVEYAKQQECRLIITVDCGITAAKEIERIASSGCDVIVTDHHELTDQIPSCVAILNPKLPQNPYPNRELTGVGVAFKLAHALRDVFVEEGKISAQKVDLKRYLDLVALGTISDMGPLLGENRILVSYGLKQMRKSKRIGLTKLAEVSDVKLSEISPLTIASKIAPRLNSLGRIADPQKGVELLLLRNAQDAEKMAIELDLTNIERQKIERTMSIDVEKVIASQKNMLKHRAIVMHSDKWHPGVIAILSTRICKQYNRPTIMIAVENGLGKGSCRSIPEFPLLPAFKECSDLLINFGGHDCAAGLSILPENIVLFKKRFLALADSKLQENDVRNKLFLDAEANFCDLNDELRESIRLMEPFGHENPQPTFHCKAKQARPPKIIGKSHLKLSLEQEDRILEAIAPGRAEMASQLRKKDLLLNIAYTLNPQGTSLQLVLRDIQIGT